MADNQTAGVADTARSAFGAYDVLSYFVPGVTLLGALCSYEWHAHSALCGATGRNASCDAATPVLSGIGTLLRLNSTSSTLQDALAIFSILLIAYVTGHVLASISAYAIDRTYVALGVGYPLQHYVGVDSPDNETQLRRCFYKGCMFWINLYLILRYFALDGILPLGSLVPRLLPTFAPDLASKENISLGATLAMYVFVAGVSSYAISNLLKFLAPAIGFPDAFAKALWLRRSNQFLEWLVWTFEKPAKLVTYPVGNASRTLRKLDDETATAFKVRLERATKSTSSVRTSLAYWLPYIEIRRSDPPSTAKLDNWLRQYSFARNLSSAFYCSFLYCEFWWLSQSESMELARTSDLVSLQLIPPILFVASFLLLQRYFFLYSDYFTKFLIRVYAFPPRRH
jgi:hypothetical protein